MDTIRQKLYADLQNYTNKTLWQKLDEEETTEPEKEMIREILAGRVK